MQAGRRALGVAGRKAQDGDPPPTPPTCLDPVVLAHACGAATCLRCHCPVYRPSWRYRGSPGSRARPACSSARRRAGPGPSSTRRSVSFGRGMR